MSEQWHYEQKGESYIKVDTLHKIRTLETELAAAREELAELKEEYGTWWAQKRIAIDELKEVTEQRDRLAEWLKWIAGWNHQLFDKNTAMQMRDKAEQALQSLNPDHTVDANDMIAAVKRGADELPR